MRLTGGHEASGAPYKQAFAQLGESGHPPNLPFVEYSCRHTDRGTTGRNVIDDDCVRTDHAPLS
ncbi:MAG: hypothetical protein ACKOD2_19585, partial [Ilumatobacteraceae bacterium]